MSIKQLLDQLMPRFLTEDVGCVLPNQGSDYAIPFLPMTEWDVSQDGEPHCVITIRCLNLFGWALFARGIGEPASYKEWKEAQSRD